MIVHENYRHLEHNQHLPRNQLEVLPSKLTFDPESVTKIKTGVLNQILRN